jgi:hypothetical protein
MKIYELKEYVYQATETKNTQELKKRHSDLVGGKDLRKKSNWLSIYNTLKAIQDFRSELVSRDIEEKYGYKEIDKNCSIVDLLHNIEATEKFREDFEEELNSLKKINTKIKK